MSGQSFSSIFSELLKLQPYKVGVAERLFCTASRKNKLQAFTKTYITYKWSTAQV